MSDRKNEPFAAVVIATNTVKSFTISVGVGEVTRVETESYLRFPDGPETVVLTDVVVEMNGPRSGWSESFPKEVVLTLGDTAVDANLVIDGETIMAGEIELVVEVDHTPHLFVELVEP